jgi:hypothetical protein
MALNPSGTLSIGGPTVGQSINLELSLAQNANSSLNQANFRSLAEVPAGQISISNFYGKSTFVARALGQMNESPVGTVTQTATANVWYCNIATGGSLAVFGSAIAPLTQQTGGLSSKTQAFIHSGNTPGAGSQPISPTVYVTTFGTSGSFAPFGALLTAPSTAIGRRGACNGSNNIYGIQQGGGTYSAPNTSPVSSSATRFTLSTAGSQTAWGTTPTGQSIGGCTSTNSTRFVRYGSGTSAINPKQGPLGVALCQTSDFATGGTWTAFTAFTAILFDNQGAYSGVWSNTRGLSMGGLTPAPGQVATAQMSYWTTATLGTNAIFGNLQVSRWTITTACSNITGLAFSGVLASTTNANRLTVANAEQVAIATLGNSTTWATLTTGFRNGVNGVMCSNNNGGLV